MGEAALVEHVGNQEQTTVEFRLNVLLAGLEEHGSLFRQESAPETATAYQKSNRRLTAYMNCVESIVMVADIVGDDAELEDKVQVVFNGERIPWRDFFYGLQEHKRLWRARQKVEGRPVSVEFERRDRERSASAPYRFNGHYQISGQFVREGGDRSYNIQVQLQIGDKALADAIWRARRVVVCGAPRFRMPDFARSRPGDYPPFAHIILPIQHPSQVFATGGGRLEMPERAADEMPRRLPLSGASPSPVAPGSGGNVPPSEGTPPESRERLDRWPDEKMSSGGPLEQPPPGPDRGRATETGGGEGIDCEGAGGDEPGPRRRRVNPARQPEPSDPGTAESGTPSANEAAGYAGGLKGRTPVLGEAVAQPPALADAAKPPLVTIETAQTLREADPLPGLVAAGRVTHQAAPSSVSQEAATTGPAKPALQRDRTRPGRGLVGRVAWVTGRGTARLVARGRSACRRILVWFRGTSG